MADIPSPDFKQVVAASGIPTTEAALQTEWNTLNAAQGGLISNDSKWSPFWRLISTIVTRPALWLSSFLSDELLPNSFIKTARGVFLDQLAWALNLTRKPATAAVGKLEFTRQEATAALSIPAGTRVQTPLIDGQRYELVTQKEASFEVGQETLLVEAQADQPGSAYNLAPGYYNELIAPIATVTAVRNPSDWLDQSDCLPGSNEESDEELRLRCRNQFTAVGEFHHDAAYRAIISREEGLRTDYIWFEHNAPRGPGSANAYLMTDSGPAKQEMVDSINQKINDDGEHGHGDDLVCYPMPSLPIDLAATVWFRTDALLSAEAKATLLVDIEAMIRSAFRPKTTFEVTQTYPYSRFSFSRLGQELHRHFSELDSIEFNLGDIATEMALAQLNSLTVTEG